MDVMSPLADTVLFPHSGTFSENPMTMTAGLISMEMFDQAAVSKLNLLADRARARITEAIAIAGISACVTGGGSMFRVHMKADVPENYRATFTSAAEAKLINRLLDHLFENGVIMIETCSGTLSTAMTTYEIDRLADVMLSGFRNVKAALPPQA